MSGYNRFEQAIGNVLTRFPRVKSAIEVGYQRANYHLFAERGFQYELHDAAELLDPEDRYGDSQGKDSRFVGFYDICPWDETMDAYLTHRLDGETATIEVFSEGATETVASTRAWNYQQGSRTQWHPTTADAVLFNDIENGSAVGRFVRTDGTNVRTYPQPIQAVRPTGDEFLSVNYRRLDRNSPGYGYGTDDGTPLREPSSDGIFRVGFDGDAELIVPFTELIDSAETTVGHENHYIHHALYAPDGDRFVFLHRWMDGEERNTRLFVSDRNGALRLLLENRHLSHFCWLDSDRLFLWGGSEEFGRGYHILNVRTGALTDVTALDGYGDGHPSISPDGEWIVTDTYPDRLRKRTLTLYHLETERTVPVGEFLAPFGFDGVSRCDLHPRWSPDGQAISIDSAHDGSRRSYVIDIGRIT